MQDFNENPYDDPYVMLAHFVLARYPHAEVVRLLEDDDYVSRQVLKETRDQDFHGGFLDCIVQSILDDRRRMEMNHELDKLSGYFYRNLDLVRFRREVQKYGKLYEIL